MNTVAKKEAIERFNRILDKLSRLFNQTTTYQEHIIRNGIKDIFEKTAEGRPKNIDRNIDILYRAVLGEKLKNIGKDYAISSSSAIQAAINASLELDRGRPYTHERNITQLRKNKEAWLALIEQYKSEQQNNMDLVALYSGL